MIYDTIGIGFGPSNIALAIAMEESGYEGKALFLEKNAGPYWHAGMMLRGSNIQNNPLRDLITPVNPRSKYTFVNYLHQSGRFFHFLNLGVLHPPRQDYYDYILWVAKQFNNVKYETSVARVEVADVEGKKLWKLTSSQGTQLLARTLVMGTGRNLNIPKINGVDSDNVIHLVDYLHRIEKYGKDARIAVLGASQSAVEIILDLLGKGYQNITSVHRSFSYCLKDTSSFSDEVYFPEFTDYYHALPHQKRAMLDEQVRRTNYSSVDQDVLEALYLALYEDRVTHRHRVTIWRNHAVDEINPGGKRVLHLRDIYKGTTEEIPCDLLILATGFLDVGRNGREGLPHLLKGIADELSWDDKYLNVERSYRVKVRAGGSLPDIYFNGLCESSHGLGDAGSFSLVSLRAKDIMNSIVQRR
jgi:L-ornithine N5-oxygenase